MMRSLAIAINTFREAIRNKILYGIAGVVAGANFFALVLGQMSLHEEARVALDVGLAGISLFGAVTAIYLGVSLLFNEVEKKTIHTILSKPIERHEFVVGKYLGMVTTLSLLVILFATVLLGTLLITHAMYPKAPVASIDTVAKAVLLGYFEVLIVAAIAVFFSAFSSPYLSGIFTFALFFLGNISEEIRMAARAGKDLWIRTLANVALRVIPDLHVFSISSGQVEGKYVSVHSSFVTWGYVGTGALMALGWIGILLIGAIVIFRRRDFV